MCLVFKIRLAWRFNLQMPAKIREHALIYKLPAKVREHIFCLWKIYDHMRRSGPILFSSGFIIAYNEGEVACLVYAQCFDVYIRFKRNHT